MFAMEKEVQIMNNNPVFNKSFANLNDIEQPNFCISCAQEISFLDKQPLNIRFARYCYFYCCKCCLDSEKDVCAKEQLEKKQKRGGE